MRHDEHQAGHGLRQPDSVCPVCGRPDRPISTVHGHYSRRDYHLNHCPACGLTRVTDPWTDWNRIYDDAYYRGEGADPLADYDAEARGRRTIRDYELAGVARIVEHLTGQQRLRWLDYGCGTGAQVAYARKVGHDAYGWEPSPATARFRSQSIPMLERLEGEFDVVTAIEVLEHTLDPVAELKAIRSVLRQDGLLFITTGNAAPYHGRIERWRYTIPEIHVSYFEPRTVSAAMELAGFRPEFVGRVTGFDQVLKFKVLKNLRLKRRTWITDLIPAATVAAAGDRMAKVTAHPVGWAT